MIEFTFWVFTGLFAYTYFGYPAVLWAVANKRPPVSSENSIEPSISIIVAAYNEQKDIARKLELLLALDYPAASRHIIVASDCSSDNTHTIVQEFEGRGVELVVLPERGGKTTAQNLAVTHATGDILVFTDATTELAPNALRELVAVFEDNSVGAAGAKLEYRSAQGSAVGGGGGLYWRYEQKIKELESRANSLIGVSGCLYAVRREDYQEIPGDLISDFVIAFDMWSHGKRTVYAHRAVSYETTNEAADLEFSMRARVIVRSINALVRRRRLLNPLRHGFFSIQLISHKILRYLVPEMLLILLLSNLAIVLISEEFRALYSLTLAVQFALYGVVPLAYFVLRMMGKKTGLLSAPFYFLLANVAAFWAQIRYLRGDRAVTWNTIR